MVGWFILQGQKAFDQSANMGELRSCDLTRSLNLPSIPRIILFVHQTA